MAPCPLLTTREAAERARVHPVTLRRLIRTGRGPAVTMLGAKELIREDSLARWIEQATERQPDQAAAA